MLSVLKWRVGGRAAKKLDCLELMDEKSPCKLSLSLSLSGEEDGWLLLLLLERQPRAPM